MSDKGIAGPRLTRLGRYEVLSELGKGAMGIVYLAKDPVIGRMVAIKTIRASSTGDDDSESREFRERFLREAQTAGILSHPNIVTIHDIGEDPETRVSFIAMEYIEGKNLKSLLVEKSRFSYDEVAALVAQVAEAIDYAHSKGIIHRDIKPANIIITADQKVKITDFGIAKIASSNLTTTGQFLGTPNYMSPEQVSGGAVDGRSDIFSLGVLLYELLTGRKPFSGDNLTAISYKIVHEDFAPPADLSNDVPPEFNPIVARAMAKDPWNRYQRGKDFSLALQQLRVHLDEQKEAGEMRTVAFMPAADPGRTLRTDTAGRGEGSRPGSKTRKPPVPFSDGSPPPPKTPPAAAPANRSTSDGRATVPLPARGARSAGSVWTNSLQPAARRAAAAFSAGWVSARGLLARAGSRDWANSSLITAGKKKVAPSRFWAITGGTAALLLVIVAALLMWSRSAAKPTAPVNTELARQTAERKQTLEQGKSLYAAARYEESLAVFRGLLARDPNNQQAKQYIKLAEDGLNARQAKAQKGAEAEKTLQLGQSAFRRGNYEEARSRAEEVLALDSTREDAQRLRQDASTQIAKAARKKTARNAASVQGAAATPIKGKVPERVAAGSAPAVPATSSGAASPVLRLLFDSPLSEGHIMVAVNDQILLRKPFSFSKRSFFKTVKGTGTVDVSIAVPTGSLAVKVWLSGPDIPASTLATASTHMGTGGSRTLRLDYSGGRLSAKIQ